MVKTYENKKIDFEAIETKIAENIKRREVLGGFIKELKKQDVILTEFVEGLWFGLLDEVVVYTDDRVGFGIELGYEL